MFLVSERCVSIKKQEDIETEYSSYSSSSSLPREYDQQNNEKEILKQIKIKCQKQQNENCGMVFSGLRNCWKITNDQENTWEKVDQINKKIGLIKNRIQHMVKKQNGNESIDLQKYIYESKQYCELQQKYYKREQDFKNRETQLKQKIQQLQQKIEAVNIERREHFLKIQQESEKSRNRDNEMLKLIEKCQRMQLQILKKQHKKTKQSMIQKQNVNKLSFINQKQNFSIELACPQIQTNITFITNRTLTQTKNFFYSLKNNTNQDKITQEYQIPKRTNIIQRQSKMRNQTKFVSQDKSKRFQRNRVTEC